MVLATIYGNLERNAVACTGRGGGNFRQRHYHLPALGRSRGIHARQLARAARRAGSRLAETVRFLGLSCLLNSLAERTRVALETNCILAITGVGWSGPGCRPPANPCWEFISKCISLLCVWPGSKALALKKENYSASPCGALVMCWNGRALSS